MRFARLRIEKRHNYTRKVAEGAVGERTALPASQPASRACCCPLRSSSMATPP